MLFAIYKSLFSPKLDILVNDSVRFDITYDQMRQIALTMAIVTGRFMQKLYEFIINFQRNLKSRK